jgi:hypothetical protein
VIVTSKMNIIPAANFLDAWGRLLYAVISGTYEQGHWEVSGFLPPFRQEKDTQWPWPAKLSTRACFGFLVPYRRLKLLCILTIELKKTMTEHCRGRNSELGPVAVCSLGKLELYYFICLHF